MRSEPEKLEGAVLWALRLSIGELNKAIGRQHNLLMDLSWIQLSEELSTGLSCIDDTAQEARRL